MSSIKTKRSLLKILFLSLAMQGASSLTAQTSDSVRSAVYAWNTLQPKKEKTSISRQIFKGNTLDLAYFEMYATTLEPAMAPHAAHTHGDTEEVIIVKQGTVKVTINGKSTTIGPSSVAVIMPGDKHGIQNAGNKNAVYYIIKMKSKLPTNRERATNAGGSFLVNWDTVTVKKTDKGQHRDIFDRPTSQFARFDVHATTLNPGQISHPPHTHRSEEMIVIIKGNVQMNIANKFYKASAGDVIFLASEIPHALNNTGDTACEYFAFQWKN
jgi:(S)-ureidoglycine aminohydrolase